jgi:hypothetical protein
LARHGVRCECGSEWETQKIRRDPGGLYTRAATAYRSAG